MKIPLVAPGKYDSQEEHRLACEQTDYLEGALWADPARRLNRHVNMKDLDEWGNGTAAFWRGLIESAGCVSILENGGGRKYPRVTLSATYAVLEVFLDWVQYELNARYGGQWSWEQDDRLRSAAGSGKLYFTGEKAQALVAVLYPPSSTIGRESIRETVDEIVSWTPRR